MKVLLSRIIPVLLLILSHSLFPGQVIMPAIFGDHMVLQRDIDIPVRGSLTMTSVRIG